jgi:hypothetical protein
VAVQRLSIKNSKLVQIFCLRGDADDEARADRDLRLEILDLRYGQNAARGAGLAFDPSAGWLSSEVRARRGESSTGQQILD